MMRCILEKSTMFYFLPKDFTTNIEAGVPSAIDAQSRPDAFAKTLIEGQVDTFLSTYTVFIM